MAKVKRDALGHHEKRVKEGIEGNKKSYKGNGRSTKLKWPTGQLTVDHRISDLRVGKRVLSIAPKSRPEISS